MTTSPPSKATSAIERLKEAKSLFTVYRCDTNLDRRLTIKNAFDAGIVALEASAPPDAEPHFPEPCGVCGRPAELCIPLTICGRCRGSPKAKELIAFQKAEFERAQRGEPSIYDLKPAPSDALEVRARIIDILDECERTVYAQQKWKVANAGLQGWLFRIDAEMVVSKRGDKA